MDTKTKTCPVCGGDFEVPDKAPGRPRLYCRKTCKDTALRRRQRDAYRLLRSLRDH